MHGDHYFLYITGINGQTVTIVSTPAGTPVSGSTNTFDYPILSSLNLRCMVDPPPSGSVIYTWDTTGCYVNNNGQRNCFPNGQSTQTVTENSLLAHDVGTITCSVSIDNGPLITSNSFTLRISGLCCYSCCMDVSLHIKIFLFPL